MTKITPDVLMKISGTIEALFLEQQEGIAFAFDNIPNLKLSITVNLDPTSEGVEANYSLTYALEAPREAVKKLVVKKCEVINSTQDLPFEADKRYSLGGE